ncbi:hypothetical protein [Nocardia sp. Marseille-Q1738]
MNRLAIYDRLPVWTSDWHRFRRTLLKLMPPSRREFESLLPFPCDPGSRTTGFPIRREFGGWAVRPDRGWRSIRWITPPLHFTRAIPAGDADAAADWALERMGL